MENVSKVVLASGLVFYFSIEVSAILSRMSNQNAVEVFGKLSSVPEANFRAEAYSIVSKNNPISTRSNAA